MLRFTGLELDEDVKPTYSVEKHYSDLAVDYQ
jgi:hypothetical protein